MLTSDHPLSSLQAEAALGSPWPTLHFFGSSEVEVVEARRRAEGVLGPLPQADLIEPWDATDPGEPWELRVALPGLEPAQWSSVGDALPRAVLVPGPGPAERVCDDLGHRQVEVVEGGGLEAELYFDAEHGGVLLPALWPVEMPEGLEALEADIAAAVASTSVELVFRSERGEGRVQPVVGRTSGRRGVQLTIPDALLDPLPGDQLLRLRRDLVAALAEVVRRRAPGGAPLAPDLLWDTRLGLTLTLWLLAPHATPLPGDTPVIDGLRCTPSSGLVGRAESLEVQVVPATPADHDRVVAEVVATAQGLGAPLVGRAPRWLRRPSGWSFCPVWEAPVDDRAGQIAEVLVALPGVGAVRVAPGEPVGLGEVWHQCDPGWHPGALRWLIRAHDGLTDRDRLERVEVREPTTRDLEVELAVARVALAQGEGAPLLARPALCRPVRDSRGREGVEVLVEGAVGIHEGRLRPALDALCRVEHPDLEALGTWAFREDGVHVHLWFPGGRGGPGPAWA